MISTRGFGASGFSEASSDAVLDWYSSDGSASAESSVRLAFPRFGLFLGAAKHSGGDLVGVVVTSIRSLKSCFGSVVNKAAYVVVISYEVATGGTSGSVVAVGIGVLNPNRGRGLR